MSNPKTAGAIALFLIVVAVVGYQLRHFFKNETPTHQVYFYNLQTKTLFGASEKLLPPIPTPSGPDSGVRAYVFKCKDSTDTNNFIAYLEKMSPESKAAAERELNGNQSPAALGFFMDKHPDAFQVRSLQDETWYSRSTPEGQAITTAAVNAADCKTLVPCLPP